MRSSRFFADSVELERVPSLVSVANWLPWPFDWLHWFSQWRLCLKCCLCNTLSLPLQILRSDRRRDGIPTWLYSDWCPATVSFETPSIQIQNRCFRFRARFLLHPRPLLCIVRYFSGKVACQSKSFLFILQKNWNNNLCFWLIWNQLNLWMDCFWTSVVYRRLGLFQKFVKQLRHHCLYWSIVLSKLGQSYYCYSTVLAYCCPNLEVWCLIVLKMIRPFGEWNQLNVCAPLSQCSSLDRSFVQQNDLIKFLSTL